MTIHLDLALPSGSSSLPEGIGRAALKRLLLGLAPDEACHATDCCQRSGGLLRHRFTLTGPKTGGLFSVALSLRSPWADVIRHRALWSPEVPQPQSGRGHQEVSRPIVARGVTACSGGWRRRLVTKLVLWCGICICDASNPFRLVGKDAVFSTNRGERGRVLPILARTRLQYESYPNGSSRSVRI